MFWSTEDEDSKYFRWRQALNLSPFLIYLLIFDLYISCIYILNSRSNRGEWILLLVDYQRFSRHDGYIVL